VATFTITHTQILDNVATVQTLTSNTVEVGQEFTISGNATFNGTYVCTARPEYLFIGVDEYGDYLYDYNEIILNQVQFAKTAANQERAASTGTLTHTIVCTWITSSDVEDWLGFTVTNPSSDYDLLTIATGAANAWSFRKRVEAGYFDSAVTAPGADAKLATIMMGGALYRERGSIDQYQSFEPLSTGSPVGGSMGQIMRLLGVNRSQVA
jgi:hypothetical protein